MLDLCFHTADGRPLSPAPRPGLKAGVWRVCPGRLATVIRFRVPIRDVQGWWAPSLRQPSFKLDWRIEANTAPHRDAPFIAFINQRGQNRCAAGLAGPVGDVRIQALMDQSTATYAVEFTVAAMEDGASFDLVVDETERPWDECLGQFLAAAAPCPSFPPAAWQPVYCTWYARHAAVSAAWVERAALAASRLGFRTMIVDDGWCIDADKRVSPQTITDWYADIGDWRPSPRKFPDMPGHVRAVQDMGMSYMLWVAPLMLGVRSKAHAALRGACFDDETEGYRVLDPQRGEESEAVIRRMAELMKDNGLDGLKVDFLDAVPATLEAGRGHAMRRFMTRLAHAIRAVKPDALIEYRQRYNGPQALPCATQFRAGDVPFDFLDNLHRIAQVRLAVGSRVPVHADPAFWRADETEDNIARHMICAMAGVPMLSMDLDQTPPGAAEAVRRWNGFYLEHLVTWRQGDWTVRYGLGPMESIACSTAAETIAIVTTPAAMPALLEQARGSLWVLNVSAQFIPGPFRQTVDALRRPASPGRVPPAGMGIVSG